MTLCFAMFVVLAAAAAPAGAATNLAAGRPVAVSATYQTNAGSNAVDTVVSDPSRWLGPPSATGNWIVVDLGATAAVAQAHVYMGYQAQAGSWITNLRFQAWNGSAFADIPGGTATNTSTFALAVTFAATVATDRIRLRTADAGYCRLRELALWSEPVPLYTGVSGPYVPDLSPPVLVNQIGYGFGAPKRFTAPTVPDGTPYRLTLTNSPTALASGVVTGGRADFSGFEPGDPGPYVIRVAPTNGPEGASVPFLVLSTFISARMTVPAVQFMADARSGVGTHPSAFGGYPWRDGTYYSFEVPSLIYLLLSDQATVEEMPRGTDYAAEKAMALATNFPFVTTTEDAGFLEALRRYYTNQPPPLTTNIPDAVQCIHFGLGVTLERPATRDWSGDERPRQIHAQTVEWCAYFLHAWPVLRNWIDDGFYRNVRDFTFAQWGVSSGLGDGSVTNDDPSSFEIDPLWDPATYGTVDKHPYKGRHAPGHSVLPNLLMAQVAAREGRADASNFLQAARTQAQWIVDRLDWSDPRTTKGQRMSEHKLLPGLAYFLRHFPGDAPTGLAAKVEAWADTMIARADNLWDFRRYETTDFDGDGAVDWSLPKLANNWNEPGNLGGLPACALAAASVITNAAKQQRLREISWAALDCLFGRNPLNAISGSRPALGFPDAEVGWTPVYSGSAGYLDACRGALASGPATEHFPYNPGGAKRHNEGWVNFNAAWNVGLAFLLGDLRGEETLAAPLPVVIAEILPAPAGDPRAEYVELFNPTPFPARLSGLTLGGDVGFVFPINTPLELAAGARCLVVRDAGAFGGRFGAGLPVSGVYTGALPDAGGSVSLGDVNGNTFATAAYGGPHLHAGYSVVYTGREGNPPAGAWRQSGFAGGSPGASDFTPIGADPLAAGSNGVANLLWHAGDGLDHPYTSLSLSFPGGDVTATGRRNLRADDSALDVEWSPDFSAWQRAPYSPADDIPHDDGTVTRTWRFSPSPPALFLRTRATFIAPP